MVMSDNARNWLFGFMLTVCVATTMISMIGVAVIEDRKEVERERQRDAEVMLMVKEFIKEYKDAEYKDAEIVDHNNYSDGGGSKF